MIPTTTSFRFALTAAAAATLALTASGCGRLVEEAAERAVEEAIEAESGGDVDVEFDNDGISIDGTDGEGNDLSLDVNEEGVTGESEEGKFTITEDGLEAEGADGSTLTADEDGFVQTDADGNVTTGEVTTDGDDTEFTITGEDGENTFRSGPGVPEEWPSDVPQPNGLSNVEGVYGTDDGGVTMVIGGASSSNFDDTYNDYVDALTDAGFAEQAAMSAPDFKNATFSRGEEAVTVMVTESEAEVSVSVTFVGSR